VEGPRPPCLPVDGSGQSDASEELLLSTRQTSSILLVVLAMHKRRCSQELTRMVSRDGSGMTTWMASRPVEAKRILIGIWRDRHRLDIVRFGGLPKLLMNGLLINAYNVGWKKGPHHNHERRQGIPEAKVFQGTNSPSLFRGPEITYPLVLEAIPMEGLFCVGAR